MALPNTGQISLQDMATEFGNSAPHQISEFYGKGNAANSGLIAFSHLYGASAQIALTINSNTQELNVQTLATAAGWSSGAVSITINSGVFIWSDDASVPAILVNIPDVTIVNNGNIMGKGGRGGYYDPTNNVTATATAGGPAISITATGCSITNSSGAYIGGGGGGGGGVSAGGGAGGGDSGRNYSYSTYGTGGAIGAAGNQGSGTKPGYGGTAGGGGSGNNTIIAGSNRNGTGGGGGRVFPGTGGAGGNASISNTLYPNGYNNFGPGSGYGGSAGSAGQIGGHRPRGDFVNTFNNAVGNRRGGGGGWGAAGGTDEYISLNWDRVDYPGGSGGGAIINTQSYTLSNSGTIYGAT